MDPKDNIFNRPEKDLANAIRGVNLADKITKPMQTIQTLSDRFQIQQWYAKKWTDPYTNLMKQLNLSNNLANNVTNYMDNINRLRQSLSDIIPINVIETLDSYETLRNSIEHNFVSFDPEKRYKISKKVWDDLDDCFEDLSNSETEDDLEACDEKIQKCSDEIIQKLNIGSASSTLKTDTGNIIKYLGHLIDRQEKTNELLSNIYVFLISLREKTKPTFWSKLNQLVVNLSAYATIACAVADLLQKQ